jgi:hypothetical protein
VDARGVELFVLDALGTLRLPPRVPAATRSPGFNRACMQRTWQLFCQTRIFERWRQHRAAEVKRVQELQA